MSTPRLSATSYIVLGLLEQAQPASPYDLKRLSQISTANFWSVPHTQLYTECARLAREGLLSEQQEPMGRRRKTYRLTERGLAALESWRSEPTDELYEARDPGILRLFLGGDPSRLAPLQLSAHRRKLAELEQTRRERADMPSGMKLALDAGIGLEREYVRFWSALSAPGGQ